ncbi:uncharacterized protein MONBRDRAFT_5820 [Monosiga brevicollis MX1]|uniref:Uncharacterized protein n=1 Tax=Monosiga brevicollis TaxID=81824 RepID=A9USK2_MONBE|nr:uncharacterized protein MONBRDRAFT_5820 [Monosiga brevicollis MX1]EDQ92115.1 predicted protein [Monosiga brevicollis MX1]|eukprot:XP_001743401.1 hypothetical protein [Monosiga brevicollis MX1]
MARVMRARNSYRSLPRSQQARVSTFIRKLRRISQDAIVTNDRLVKTIAIQSGLFDPAEAEAQVATPAQALREAVVSQQRASSNEGGAPSTQQLEHSGHSSGHHSHDHSAGVQIDPPNTAPQPDGPPTDFEMDKVYTTIKQFYRDWSAEGQSERDHSYGRLLDAVDKAFANAPKYQSF